MALTFSTELKQAWLGDGASDDSLKELLNGTKIQINIYKNEITKPRPTSADSALSSYTALASIIVTGPAGGTFDSASAGVLSKAAAEVWFDSSCAAGEVSWFRLFVYGEDPTTASSAETLGYRIDGSCGSTGTEDLVLASATLLASQVLTIDVFNISLP